MNQPNSDPDVPTFPTTMYLSLNLIKSTPPHQCTTKFDDLMNDLSPISTTSALNLPPIVIPDRIHQQTQMPYVDNIHDVSDGTVAEFKQFNDDCIGFPMKFLHDRIYDITTKLTKKDKGRKKGFREGGTSYLMDKLFEMKKIPPMIIPYVVKYCESFLLFSICF